MKKYFALFGLTLAAFAFTCKEKQMLEIGAKAPMTDYKMKDVSGKSYSLADLKKENGLLVIFSCNTCPFVLGWEDQYPKLKKVADENKIGMVLINSNEAKRGDDDSMDAMKEHHKKANYNMPYVVDVNHRLADVFGAKTTPHVYLFNGDMRLAYRGLINNRYDNRSREVTETYLEDALTNLAAGKNINLAITQEKGCSIKRIKA